MLAKLDGKTLEGTGVQAGQEAFHDELGAQIQPGNLANDFRAKIFFCRGHELFRKQELSVGTEEALPVYLVNTGGRAC